MHSKKNEKSAIFAHVNPMSREMRFFMTCAETGSILKASERLVVQQAGLSKIIRKMEDDIGKDLFHRNARGVQLTEYGQALYNSLQKVNKFWNQTYFSDVATGLGVSGTLKIGCHSSIAANTYPKFFHKLIKHYPSLNLQTVFMRSVDATNAMAENKIDIAIVINPIKHSELSVRPIKSEHIALYKSIGENESAMVYNPEMFNVAKVISQYPNRRHIAIADYETIANLVKQTDLQGVLPSTVAERYELQAVGTRTIRVNLAVVYNRKKIINDEKSGIIDLIVDSLK